MSESEPAFIISRRESEELWTQALPVGATMLFKCMGCYTDRKSLFEFTESQLYPFDDQVQITYIPVVVVIVSPFPPSDKIAIVSEERDSAEIVDMESANVGWDPYIPQGEGAYSDESQIFILGCVQRDAAWGAEIFQSCVPYFNNPFKTEEESSVVDIIYPIQVEARALALAYDWELDEPEEFTNALTAAKELPGDHKDAFKELVNKEVEEGKRANHEALRKWVQAQEESSAEQKAAFEKMRFYKIYPVATRDTPDISSLKSSFINRYYGKAHQVF